MLEYQRGELEQPVRHARAHAPFYERRFDMLFRPDGTIDWDRWSEVPILRRAERVARHDELLADQLPAGHFPGK